MIIIILLSNTYTDMSNLIIFSSDTFSIVMNFNQNTQWYTVAEACEYLRVSKTTIYDYMKDERLPFFYLAGTRSRRLRRQDLDALLEPGQPNDLELADADI